MQKQPLCFGYNGSCLLYTSLWKISLEQNQMALQEQPADQQLLAQAVIDGEVQKAEHIEQYSDEELAAITVFGLPGMYAKHLFALQPAKLHLADQKPLLVLQGGKDRQVTPKNGLEAWEQALEGHPDATYKLYENLNHIMGDYQGDPVPFLQLTTVEYMQRTPVPAYVVDDIAAWINAHLA